MVKLPDMNCGLCGYRTCAEFAVPLAENPELIKRCINLSDRKIRSAQPNKPESFPPFAGSASMAADACQSIECRRDEDDRLARPENSWQDSLGRDFDFFLEYFPEDPGPREIILPHNPMLTREMDIQPGEILIGRPLGMSCGCPITHCGVVQDADHRTGVINWCVTGPLHPREKGYKDIGYYIAEGYEGLVTEARCKITLGRRYFFQPRMCMLNWRHSGLVNYVNRTPTGLQVRIEGLWIG